LAEMEKTIFIYESRSLLNKKDNSSSINILLSKIVFENNNTDCLGVDGVKAISDYFDLAVLRQELDKQCTLMLDGLLTDPMLQAAFTVNGLFYLRLMREDFGYTFVDIIKRIIIIEKIIAIEKPSEIIIFENTTFLSQTLAPSLGDVIKAVSSKHGIRTKIERYPLAPLTFKFKFFMAPLFFSINSPLNKYRIHRAKSWFNNHHHKVFIKTIKNHKKTIFIPYSDAERVHLEPVLTKLTKDRKFICRGIKYPADFEQNGDIDSNGKQLSYSLFDYFPSNSTLAKKMKRDSWISWKKSKHLLLNCQALNFNGINLGALTEKLLDIDVKFWLKDIINYYIATTELIRTEQPDCLLASKERELFMRTVLAATRNSSVPSVVIQHGIYYDSYLWDPIDATKLCVDEVFREILIKRGENPSKIVVTGSPVYDKILSKLEEDITTIRKRLSLNQSSKYVCFLTSILPEWSEPNSRLALLSSLIKSVEKMNCDLLIRLHPRENKRELEVLITNIKKPSSMENRIRVISFEEADLFDIILASDIIVAVRTSALIIGLLAKKPSVLIAFDRFMTDFFSNIEGSIYGVAKTPLELSKLLENLNFNSAELADSTERAYKYARRYVPFDNATDKVIECILGLVPS
jgi:hypothetical protein